MIKEYYIGLGFTVAQMFHDGGRRIAPVLTGSVQLQVLIDVKTGQSR
jgi:hypothetical protein